MTLVTKQDIENRLHQVKEYIVAQKADACVISSPVNLYYLNGFIFTSFCFAAHRLQIGASGYKFEPSEKLHLFFNDVVSKKHILQAHLNVRKGPQQKL